MTTKTKTLQSAVWVKCTADAHKNPYIDHCFVCMPWWGKFPTCPVCGRKVRETLTKYKCNHCNIFLKRSIAS